MNHFPTGSALLRWPLALVAAALLLLGGYQAGRHWPVAELSSEHPSKDLSGPLDEPEILYWVAPMDPDYRRDGPGKSPMGMDLVPVYADSAAAGSDAGAAARVRIDPAVTQNLGLRTARVESRRLPRQLRTTAVVAFDEDRLAHLHVRANGWVERLLVDTEGERVAAGQLLFEFYSPDLVYAQQEFVQDLTRQSDRLVSAARERLRALGMADSQIDELERSRRIRQTVDVFAPMDGVVSRLGVREGMYIEPDTEVMSLGDLSVVWLLADLPQQGAAWIRAGDRALVRFDHLPAEELEGAVDYVYPVLDPATRSLRARVLLDNPGWRLRPNMYAGVTLSSRDTEPWPAVPREALIRGGGPDRVVVVSGAGEFEPRAVTAGLESGSWIEIREGLEPGEEVVTSAQFLIDSEASLTGALARLAEPSSEATPGRTGHDQHDMTDHGAMDHDPMDHDMPEHEMSDGAGMEHDHD
jgi:Cu(I)/Ag(I) efflux system membrane fusion protein